MTFKTGVAVSADLWLGGLDTHAYHDRNYVIMEKNQPWTNRVIGSTDARHFSQRINPATLERDDRGGSIICPKHVHKALRRCLGIEGTPVALRFPFNNTEDFAFFG